MHGGRITSQPITEVRSGSHHLAHWGQGQGWGQLSSEHCPCTRHQKTKKSNSLKKKRKPAASGAGTVAQNVRTRSSSKIRELCPIVWLKIVPVDAAVSFSQASSLASLNPLVSTRRTEALNSALLALACTIFFPCLISFSMLAITPKKRKAGDWYTEGEIISKKACCHGNRLSNAFLRGRCQEWGHSFPSALPAFRFNLWQEQWMMGEGGWAGKHLSVRNSLTVSQGLKVWPVLTEPSNHSA